jgi:hypothetical protein
MQHAARNLSNPSANDTPASPSALTELRDAHRQLHNEVANMKAVTREPQPDADRLANARWRISQASLRRRRISASIRDALLPAVGVQDRVTLKSLQEADLELHRKSREHVSTWTTQKDKFETDWQGYCKAAQLMLMHTDNYLLLEEGIFYPIIERAGRRSHLG